MAYTRPQLAEVVYLVVAYVYTASLVNYTYKLP